MKNIKSFLTPHTKDYYDKVLKIVTDLEEFSGVKIVIFGGFVRSIIEGSIPRDVDLWFKYVPPEYVCTPGIWRRRILDMIPKIREKYNITNLDIFLSKETEYENKGDENYEIATIKIQDIPFDFCCDTSSLLNFTTLADFSVNNLYMGLDGELKTRVNTNHTVNDIISHIKERKLIHITDMEIIKTYLSPYRPKYDLEYYKNKMVQKETKMISYGFNF
jgi:hypothetical protein